MTGTHVVEEFAELDQWRPRRVVWKEWEGALGGRAVRNKEAEEEGDLPGIFFYRIYVRFPLPLFIILRFLLDTPSSLSDHLLLFHVQLVLSVRLSFTLPLHLLLLLPLLHKTTSYD